LYNCQGHLDSKTHKAALEGFNIDEDSESKEALEPKNENESEGPEKRYRGSVSQEDQLITDRVQEKPDLQFDDTAELRFSFMKFILENRLPFSIVKNLCSFISDLSEQYSSRSLQSFKTSRQTIVKLTREVCKDLKTRILSQLKTTPFSLSIDASSVVYGSAYLAICAKYIDNSNPDHVLNKLVSILPLTTSSTGQVLFEKLMNDVLSDEDIQRNLMGICANQGSNMMGDEKGLCFRLKKQFPYIVVVKDFSHVYNTIFKKGLKAVPDKIVNIVTGICKHFSYSTKESFFGRNIN